MGMNSEAQLNRKVVDLIKLANIYLNHFPKHEKYALAQRIRNTAYDVYDLITESQKRYHKKTTLSSLDIAHERLRMQLHLAHQLGYFAFKDGRRHIENGEVLADKRYLAISRMVDEVGRMIGGWIAKTKDDQKW